MRRLSRVNRSIDLAHARASQNATSHVCLACRFQANSFSTSSPRAREKVDFTEKIRSKIWGTDQPPGQKNPYGESSVFDRTRKGKQQQEATQEVEDGEVVEESNAERRMARVSNRPSGVDPNYIPAETWDGLDTVGDTFTARLRPGNEFEAFVPKEVATNTAEITAALHRAVVEIFILKQAGKPFEVISSKPASLTDWTQDVKIIPNQGGAKLEFRENAGTVEDVVRELQNPTVSAFGDIEEVEETRTDSEQDIDADRAESPLKAVEKPTESQEDLAADKSDGPGLPGYSELLMTHDELVSSFDPAWLDVPLENNEIKFALIKRVFQLTGIKYPDSEIHQAKTVRIVLSKLLKPPKAQKLAEALEQNGALLGLPNVSISARRVTRLDKEISLGRHKLIEEELRKRGLPLYDTSRKVKELQKDKKFMY